MTALFRTIALSLGSLTAARAYAQSTPPSPGGQAWVSEHYHRKTDAMTALAAWGGANVLAGGVSALAADGTRARQFHLMNAGWGAVNAALGLFGRRSAIRDARAGKSLPDAYADLRRTEKILLFNAGLDLGYVAAGAYLLERSRRPGSDTSARDRGWGQAVILQGAALFAFDLLAYRYLHRGEQALRIGGERGVEVRIGGR